MSLVKILLLGLSWWHSGWEFACQCGERGFDPWSGKIPHAMGQQSPRATTTEPSRPRAHAPQQKKPLQWGASTLQRRGAPTRCIEKSLCGNGRPSASKKKSENSTSMEDEEGDHEQSLQQPWNFLFHETLHKIKVWKCWCILINFLSIFLTARNQCPRQSTGRDWEAGLESWFTKAF